MVLLLRASVIPAAEVKVLAPGALRPVLTALSGEFQRSAGHTFAAGYGSAGEITKRLSAGEAADVAIVPTGAIATLVKHDRIVAGTAVEIALVKVAVAVRAGTSQVDISSADALRRALLAANSITYTDPARGASAGVHFATVLHRLGIEAAVKPKTRFASGGVAYVVAKGEADIGITQMSELVGIAGITVLGPLPGEFDHTSSFSAAVATATSDSPAAQSLVDLLAHPATAKVLKIHGMERGELRAK